MIKAVPIAVVFGAISITSCIRTNSVTLGRKTDLERQLMGRLEPLSEEQLLVASVRAREDPPTRVVSELEERAIAARRRQLFNRDDLAILKVDGCVGEARDASVIARGCADSSLLDERDRLIEEENADRAAIIEWVIESDAQLVPGDRRQLRLLYHTMMTERSPVGTPIEDTNGKWSNR